MENNFESLSIVRKIRKNVHEDQMEICIPTDDLKYG